MFKGKHKAQVAPASPKLDLRSKKHSDLSPTPDFLESDDDAAVSDADDGTFRGHYTEVDALDYQRPVAVKMHDEDEKLAVSRSITSSLFTHVSPGPSSKTRT